MAILCACGSDEPAFVPGDAGEDAGETLDAAPLPAPLDAAVPGDASRDGSRSDASTLPPRPFDWVQLISTGQSLSAGSQGLPVDPSPQPYQNLKLFDSSPVPNYDNSGDMLSLLPLTSPIRVRDPLVVPAGAYPANLSGETVSEGLSNQVSALSLAREGLDYVSIATAVGQGGRRLEIINKQPGAPYPTKPAATDGRLAYWASMYEATQIKELAKLQNKRFGVGAVFLTHGESDAAIGTGITAAEYEAGVVKLAQDYDADLRAITGQTQKVMLFTSQQGSFPPVADVIPSTTNALWSVSVKNPSDIVCVGPKYQYEYVADRVHLPAAAYERVGEKYAEAYYETVVMGKRWRPLEPVQVTRVGREITVRLHVPYPPLSWDEAFAAPHQSMGHPWSKGKGFEVATAAGAKLVIDSVAIVGSAVRITLAADPPAGALAVRYAIVQDVAGAAGGLPEGRHGLLRDADPFAPRDTASIPTVITTGSAIVTAATPNAFARRTTHDRVKIAGMAEELVVVARSGNTLTLSGPVTAPSGAVMATYASDQRNYLVHFEWALP